MAGSIVRQDDLLVWRGIPSTIDGFIHMCKYMLRTFEESYIVVYLVSGGNEAI